LEFGGKYSNNILIQKQFAQKSHKMAEKFFIFLYKKRKMPIFLQFYNDKRQNLAQYIKHFVIYFAPFKNIL